MNSYTLGVAPNAANQQVPYAELTPDLSHIEIRPPITKRRVACDDEQASEFSRGRQ